MTTPQPIPLVDLGAQHREVADEVLAGFADVLGTTAFIGGPQVGAFEREFAAYCETTHCVGAANGTDAIELVLRGLDIGRGDEVVIPANTFIATAEAVVRAGADVVLVDCSDDTLLIDPDLVDAAVSPRTRAVIGVDLYGQIAPFDRLADVVDAERVALVEDAAQSQGAVRNGRKIGADVAAAATSFYPGKNLGAYGDAGAVVTNDGNLAERVRAIGGHGGMRRYEHELVGFNSRLDTLQAVVLSAKLRRLDCWNDLRRQAATRYDELLCGFESIVRLTTAPGNIPVWHLYPVRVAERDRVLAELHQAGIGAGIHYPQPLHLTGAFSSLDQGVGTFPIAERAASTQLSLPIFPHITYAQQVRVVETLVGAVS